MYAVLSRREVVHSPPAHLQAKEREDQQKAQPFARSSSHKSEMYIHHIAEPCDQSPCLLRIPAPVMAPCLFRPDRTRKHAECKERRSDIHKRICSLEHLVAGFEQSEDRHKERTAEERIREHVYGDMRNEPRTLQRRHQRLVMDFRLEDVQNYKYGGEHCRERQDPSVSPPEVSEKTRQQCKEGIPQSCLPHRLHRRTTEAYPHQHDERRKHKDRNHAAAYRKSTTLPVFQGRRRPMIIGTKGRHCSDRRHEGRADSKPYEEFPGHISRVHFFFSEDRRQKAGRHPRAS